MIPHFLPVILLTFILLAFIVFFIVQFEDNEYSVLTPISVSGIYTPITLRDISLYLNPGSGATVIQAYAVYFPLRNLSKLVVQETDASLDLYARYMEDVVAEFGPLDTSVYVNYLNSLGTVQYVSPSGTCCIFFPNLSFYEGIPVKNFVFCSATNTVGILNNYFTFPFGMIFNNFNFCDVPAADKDTLAGNVSYYQMLNQTVQTASYSVVNAYQYQINVPKTTGLPLGLIAPGGYSISAPFAQNYNVDYVGIEPADIVLSSQYIYNFQLGVFGSSDIKNLDPVVILLDAEDATPQNIQISVDYVCSFSTRTQGQTWVYNQLQFSNPHDQTQNWYLQDIYSQMWFLMQMPGSPRIWSSSFMLQHKIHPKDYARISNEGRLLSLCGMTFFNASGDNGSWIYNNFYTDTFSFYQPDMQLGYLFGESVVKVGGSMYYNNPNGENDVRVMGNVQTLNPADPTGTLTQILTTSGGYYRGYAIPYWKVQFSRAYQASTYYYRSVCDINDTSGVVSQISGCEINLKGTISPDIVYQCNLEVPYNGISTFASTGVACSLFASSMQTILDQRQLKYSISYGIPCLSQIFYGNVNYVAYNRDVQGRNPLYSFPGFVSDVTIKWDPVQGLGSPNYGSLMSILV